MEQLDKLEAAVLRALFEGDEPLLQPFRSQVEVCWVTRRELTGVGFFTDLGLPQDIPKVSLNRRRATLCDIHAEIPGLRYGAGFIVYIEDGLLVLLEGYSYQEEWPTNVEDFKLSYSGEKRDYSSLFGV
jgi:hypothetical protein